MLQFLWIIAIATSQMVSDVYTTDATVFMQPMTWNDANQYCKSIGKNLITVNTLGKSKMIEMAYFDNYYYQFDDFQVWIGLHNVDFDNGGKYKWSNNCTLQKFDNWSTDKNDTVKNVCAYIDISVSMEWISAPCNSELRPFMCESKRRICTSSSVIWYEKYVHAEGLGPTGTESYSVAETSCENLCNIFAENSTCWGFLYDTQQASCKLYNIIDDPFYNDYHNRHTHNVATHNRRCMYIFDIDYQPQTVSYDSCGEEVFSQCSPFQCDKATHVSIDMVFPTTLTEQTVRETTLPDKNSPEMTTGISEMSKAMVTSSSKSALTEGKLPFCECTCRNQTISLTLQESIEEIVNFLKIDETKTSAYIRARTCAKDQRPSSASIGYFGILMLSIPFVFILLIDLHSLYSKIF